MLLESPPQEVGDITHGRWEKDLAVAVLRVVLSANDLGEECSEWARVWQANRIVLSCSGLSYTVGPPLGCRARIELSERASVAWRGPAAGGPMPLYNPRPPPKGAGFF